MHQRRIVTNWYSRCAHTHTRTTSKYLKMPSTMVRKIIGYNVMHWHAPVPRTEIVEHIGKYIQCHTMSVYVCHIQSWNLHKFARQTKVKLTTLPVPAFFRGRLSCGLWPSGVPAHGFSSTSLRSPAQAAALRRVGFRWSLFAEPCETLEDYWCWWPSWLESIPGRGGHCMKHHETSWNHRNWITLNSFCVQREPSAPPLWLFSPGTWRSGSKTSAATLLSFPRHSSASSRLNETFCSV